MRVIEINPNHRKQVKNFVDLPFRLYRDTPQWVPPLRSEALHLLDPRRNAFFRHSEAVFLLAVRDKQAVGRLAVLNHRNYNRFNNTSAGFFYLFECENNLQTAQALFETAYVWAEKRGLNRLQGPKRFSPPGWNGLAGGGL